MSLPKRLVIVEPGLRDFLGHYFNVTYLLAEECERRGLPYLILCNRAITDEAAAALPSRPIPHFSMGTYFGCSADPLSGPLEDYLGVNRDFMADLFGLTTRLDSGDAVLVPTASERVIAAFAAWLSTLPPSRRPRVIMSFSFDPDGVDDDKQAHTLRLLYRAGFNAIHRSGMRPWFTLVSNSALEEYRSLAQSPVAWVPIAQPSRRTVERFGLRTDGDHPPTVACLGLSAARKGFELLPDIVRATLRAEPGVRFVVQIWGYGPGAAPDEALASAVRRLRDIAAAYPNALILHRGPIDFFGYYALLGAADVVLTAYSPEYDQISGVFHEAVAFGKVVVARSDTALDHAAREFGAAIECFDALTPEAVAAALARAVRSLDATRDRAAGAAARWLETAGTGPYLDRIFEACTEDAARATENVPPAREDGRHVLLELGHDTILSLDKMPQQSRAGVPMGDPTAPVALTAIDEATKVVQLYRARCEALQREADQLRSSTSWRITAPLRALRRLAARHGTMGSP